jgi:hypothetical protein
MKDLPGGVGNQLRKERGLKMKTARCAKLAGRLSKAVATNVDDQRAIGTSRYRAIKRAFIFITD